MRAHLFAPALFLSLAVSASAREPLTIAVSPLRSFAPTNLVVRVRLVPDAANRAVEVVAESEAYYRSSRVQIDGDEASQTMSFDFRNVPGGHYDVSAALFDSAGHQRTSVRTEAFVIPSAGDESDQ